MGETYQKAKPREDGLLETIFGDPPKLPVNPRPPNLGGAISPPKFLGWSVRNPWFDSVFWGPPPFCSHLREILGISVLKGGRKLFSKEGRGSHSLACATKGGRQKEFDHFFRFRDSFGHFFSDASVTSFVTFLPNSFCQTPFVAG